MYLAVKIICVVDPMEEDESKSEVNFEGATITILKLELDAE